MPEAGRSPAVSVRRLWYPRSTLTRTEARMERKLLQLESFPAKGADGADYTVYG